MKKVLLSLLFAVCVMSGALAQKSRVVITTDTLACGSFTWIDGNTYTSDTAVLYQTTDTLFVLNLTISANIYSEDEVLNGECYAEWNGKIFKDAGTITDTLPAAGGCDSIITRTLILTKVHNMTPEDLSACSPYYWKDDTIRTTPAEPLHDTIHNEIYNCDSIRTINLTIVENYERTDVVEYCGNYSWYDSIYLETTQDTITRPGAEGLCDSTLILNLTITAHHDTTAKSACKEYKWSDGTRLTYNESGYYNDTISDAQNCKTVKTLNLTIVPVAQTSDTQVLSACNKVGYTYNGRQTTYFRDTTVSYLFSSRSLTKCYDSTAVIVINVKHSSRIIESVSVCDSFYWDAKSKLYTQNATDSVRVAAAANGCDSTLVLNLTVNKSPKILSIEGNLLVSPGNSTTLTAVSDKENVDYRWEVLGSSQVSTENNITIENINSNTDVSLKLSDSQTHCEAMSYVTIICGLSGIEENEEADIHIYPNPTSAQLNIESNNVVREAAIFNALGQQVSLYQNLSGKSILDLNTLSNGTYTLRMMMADGNIVVRKFIVKK